MQNKPIYIVISGKKGVGKNYFATGIQNFIEYKTSEKFLTVEEIAFATPIKNFCHEVFGIPIVDMETQEGKQKLTHIRWSDIAFDIADDNGKRSEDLNHICFPRASTTFITIRELLQIIGTDLFRRRFYDPIWTKAAFLKPTKASVVIITDCRFRNEIEEAKKHNAILLRIENPNVKSDGTHQSEIDLDDYPFSKDEIFINNVDGYSKINEFIADTLWPKILQHAN